MNKNPNELENIMKTYNEFIDDLDESKLKRIIQMFIVFLTYGCTDYMSMADIIRDHQFPKSLSSEDYNPELTKVALNYYQDGFKISCYLSVLYKIITNPNITVSDLNKLFIDKCLTKTIEEENKYENFLLMEENLEPWEDR